jgi:hypothetical protein
LIILLWQAAAKKTTIGNTDDYRFTILVNSTSMAVPIGLLPKMAKFATFPTDCQWGVNTAAPYGGCKLILLQSVG